MFPDVTCQDRVLASLQGTPSVRRGFNDKFSCVILHKPSPTGSKLPQSRLGKLLLKGFKTSKALSNRCCNLIFGRSSCFGGERMPIKSVIPNLSSIVKNRP